MSLPQIAIEQIKGMVARGELQPGDRLPREPELAARLGLSRGSLREAVRGLILLGVLEARQGDGTYVTSLEPQRLLQSVSFLVELNQDATLPQILDARRMLEAGAAACAAHRASEAQLAQLGELVEAMAALHTVEAFVENDLAFHRLIAVAAGNPVVVALLDNLSSRTARARTWRGRTEAGANERTQGEHAAIQAALAQRRADVAAALVTAHIAGVQLWFERAVR
jgi:DNA-binding FadR family transcriptional regulator